MSGIMSTPMPWPVVAVARTIIGPVIARPVVAVAGSVAAMAGTVIGPVVISRSVPRLMVIPVTGSVVMVAATVPVSSVGGGLLGIGRMGLAASALCFGYRGGYHGQSGQESGDGFHQSVHNSDFVLLYIMRV